MIIMPHMYRITASLICLIFTSLSYGQEHYILDQNDDWELRNAPEEGSPEAQLAQARKQLAEGNAAEAQRLATIWLDRNKRNPLAAEAYLVRGDALFNQKEYYESLFDYELIARSFYESEAFQIALQREFKIAQMFANGTLRKKWGIRFLDATDEAEELFFLIQERSDASILAESAGIELADLYFRRSQMKLAAEAYQLFIENYPMSTQVGKAKQRLVYARLATYRGPAFDDKGLIDARDELIQLETLNPRHAKKINSAAIIVRIDESVAQKMLRTAQWYMVVNNPISAEYTVRRLVEDHLHTQAAIEALEHLVPAFMHKLPPIVLEEIGDTYQILQEELLGETFITKVETVQ
jgi:outer membrane protein assembly factor BamD (BamD/ComL family)|tara:strand:- start:2607 stop:3665 length:1059 start_codon:yes stop_codon:yes gene_type:complete